MDSNAHPDYNGPAHLKEDGGDTVQCNWLLWLPRDHHEDVRMSVVVPNIDAHSFFERFGKRHITLTTEDEQSAPFFRIVASQAYIQQVASAKYSSGVQVTFLHIEELSIEPASRPAPHGGPPPQQDELEHLFVPISQLDYGRPFMDRAFTARRSQEEDLLMIDCRSCCEPNGYFRLGRYYRYEKIPKTERRVAYPLPVLYWYGDRKTRISDLDALRRVVDEICLLMTFAAGHRVSPYGFTYLRGGHEAAIYRDPLERPRAAKEETAIAKLVDERDFESFIQTALGKWNTLPRDTWSAITSAIAALHPFREHGSSNYLTMFSSLERLAALYSSQEDSTSTLSEKPLSKAWPSLRKDLARIIDERADLCQEDQKMLKKNLRFLKPIRGCEKLLKPYLRSRRIETYGLWAIYGQDGSLCWIRDELAHGRRFKGEAFSSFIYAKEHLRVLLERVVLRELDWDPKKSAAGYGSPTTRRRLQWLIPQNTEGLMQRLLQSE